MDEGARGAIVNMIADIWNGWPHFAHSAAARGGMLTLSESAATEWAAAGVRVNTIAPGSVASSGLDTYDSKDTDFIRNEVACEIPLQRFGTEAEVAAAVVFLLSPAASFITGTVSGSTAGHRTPSRDGGSCSPCNTTPPSTGFTAPPYPPSSNPTARTSERCCHVSKSALREARRGRLRHLEPPRGQERHRHRSPRTAVRYLARLPRLQHCASP